MMDWILPYSIRGKRRSRCEKQNGDGFGTSVSYDFGGSDFAVSGAYLSDRTGSKICSAAVRAIKPKHGLRV
ncbi:porin [Salmonella enterica subsp. enterica serovar Kentucky]|nr:porin [Salmonella enterica subsp. enterica serovar Kentucky]